MAKCRDCDYYKIATINYCDLGKRCNGNGSPCSDADIPSLLKFVEGKASKNRHSNWLAKKVKEGMDKEVEKRTNGLRICLIGLRKAHPLKLK
jgi:hypothetical protein